MGAMAAPRYALPVVLLLALAGAALLASKLLDSIARGAATDTGGTAKPRAAPDPAADGAAASGARDAERVPESAPAAAANPADDGPPLLPAERRHTDFTARVEDPLGAPVADVDVRIDSTLGGFERGLEIQDDRAVRVRTTSGADGRVRVAQLAEGAYRLRARAADGRAHRMSFAFRVADAGAPLRVELEDPRPGSPGVELTVIGEDGSPVADARVVLHGGIHGDGVVGDGTRPPLQATSDANGRARFAGLEWDRGLATAHAPDGRVGSVVFDEFDHQRDSEFETSAELVVHAGGRVAGRLIDAPGVADRGVERALAGATVEAFLATSQEPWYWTFGATFPAPVVGRAFEVEGLPPGRYSFVLRAPAGARLVLDRYPMGEKLANSVVPAIAEVKGGATTEVALAVAAGASVRGRVHRPDGSPVRNAAVLAVFAPRTSNFPEGFLLHGVNVWRFDSDNELGADHPLTHVRARTDARGEYLLSGLQPGVQRVVVTAPGLCFDRREGVAVLDGKTTTLDHELEPAGALQGIAPDDSYVGITRTGDATPTAIAILGGARSFTFAGLRPGEYAIAQFHSDASVAPIEFARAKVVAGRTTFVDLTDAPGPVEIAGRVVDATGPVLDAVVALDERSVAVDGNGRFALHRFFPLGEFELRVTSRRTTWRFLCDARAREGRGWQGDLRLGDESLRVECAGPRGATIAGDVRLEMQFDGEDRSRDAPAVGSDPRLRGITSERLPLDDSGRITLARLNAGRYALRLRFANGAELVEPVTLPHPDVVTVAVPACATLVARVVDADGKPVPRWVVSASSYLRDGAIPDDVEGHDEWFQLAWAETDERGVATIPGVRAGRVLVRVSGPLRATRLAPAAVAAQLPAPARIELGEDERRDVELRLLPIASGR
jgi:hypothetical protein